jgi:hypothetical protein
MTRSAIADVVVLMVLAREPTGRMTGRKQVLATALRSLRSAGATVYVVALTRETGPAEWLGFRVHRVPPPSLPRAAMGALAALGRGRPLNEALYDAIRLRRRVAAIADACGAQVAVADTLRAWAAAAATGLPVVAHLDDLLSERYAGMGIRTGDPVLGYYNGELPVIVRGWAEWVARRMVGVEARRCRLREEQIARTSAVTALTSPADARRFAARCGEPIVALSMAAAERSPVEVADAPDGSALFLGGLDYAPNLRALRWWRDRVLPRARARGVDVRLTVIGHAAAEHRREFAGPEIALRGYVDDLDDAMCGHRLSVVPVDSGAGIKTKVLDAMSAGLPVVATPAGLSGIPVDGDRHALVADEPDAFADHVVRLAGDAAIAGAIGRAGRELIRSTFAPAQIETAWVDAVSRALANGGSRAGLAKHLADRPNDDLDVEP